MEWSEVIAHPSLQNLPFKIELNEYGQIVMTPAKNIHGRYQLKIGSLLELQLSDGEAMTECSVQTTKGVKVADVAWCSAKFIEKHGYETPYSRAPEICVEIISPGNQPKELQEKMTLYLEAGAKEVWLVAENGKVEFYNNSGKISRSSYPVKITL